MQTPAPPELEKAGAWTPWAAVQPFVSLNVEAFHETFDGGQAFRWRSLDSSSLPLNGFPIVEGIFLDLHLRLSVQSGFLFWSQPTIDEALHAPAEVQDTLGRYLAIDNDFAELSDRLHWRGDSVLKHALGRYPGLRILRQPPGETLLAFLLSSNKQISQIKACLEALARAFGQKLRSGVHALPTWERLAACSLSELQACRLGYRAAYVQGCAQILQNQPDFFSRIEAMQTPKAAAHLRELPGVGPKVADCILLFAFGRLEVFPMDVWIIRCLREAYGLKQWSEPHLRQFAALHFSPAPGLAQQFLFADRRFWNRPEKLPRS